MVRTRVVQTLYSYLEDADRSQTEARKQLLRRFSDTYTLYHLFLLFPDALTRYAFERDGEGQRKAKAMHVDHSPEHNLMHNRIVEVLDHCEPLRHYADRLKLEWDSAHSLVEDVYDRLMEDERYVEYRKIAAPTFEEDKAIYRHILTTLVAQSPALEDAMEELEVRLDGSNWVDDSEVVLSFVVKTLRKAKEGEPLELMEMFDSEEELRFATTLLEKAISDHEESDLLIEQHLKGWDKDRVAKMDRIIIETAIAEIRHFPEIALQISMNEYIELSKSFCSEKSYQFVNGCLNEIIKKLNIIHKQPC